MTKKDFIHLALLAHMLVNLEKKTPKQVVTGASAIWEETNKVAGGSTPKKSTAKPKKPDCGWYKTLQAENDTWFEFFEQFWTAWSDVKSKTKDTRGRDQAAGEGLLICRADQPNKEELKHWVYAAGVYAAERTDLALKQLNPVMASRYINERRFSGVEPYREASSQATCDFIAKQRREIMTDITHFKQQFDLTKNDIWQDQIKSKEKELEKLRKGKLNVSR